VERAKRLQERRTALIELTGFSGLGNLILNGCQGVLRP
jgi:hypothetical protein